jgi:hypothetical protein
LIFLLLFLLPYLWTKNIQIAREFKLHFLQSCNAIKGTRKILKIHTHVLDQWEASHNSSSTWRCLIFLFMYDSVFFRGVQLLGEPLLQFLDFLKCNVDLFTDFKTEPPPKSLAPGLCTNQMQKYVLPFNNHKVTMEIFEIRTEVLFYWLSVGYKLNESSVRGEQTEYLISSQCDNHEL